MTWKNLGILFIKPMIFTKFTSHLSEQMVSARIPSSFVSAAFLQSTTTFCPVIESFKSSIRTTFAVKFCDDWQPSRLESLRWRDCSATRIRVLESVTSFFRLPNLAVVGMQTRISPSWMVVEINLIFRCFGLSDGEAESYFQAKNSPNNSSSRRTSAQ